MGRRERIADPWGVLLAAAAGGTAWVVLAGVAPALPVGLGVAATVYVVKVAAGARRAPRRVEPAGLTPLPEPRRGTQARALRDRAERALRRLDATVASAAGSTTREQLQIITDEAADTRAGIRRLAGQAAAFTAALHRIPAGPLEKERRRLVAAVRRSGTPEAAAQHRAALAGVEAQLAAHARLTQACEITLARLQSTTLGLEGLGTRAIELLALAAGIDHLPDDRRVEDLADELEALRLGMTDVEHRTRPAAAPGTEPTSASG